MINITTHWSIIPELAKCPIKVLSRLNIGTNLKYLFVVQITCTLPSYYHTWGKFHISVSFYLLCIFIQRKINDSSLDKLSLMVILSKVKSEVVQSCPALCDPMDCSLPRSSIHGIFQAAVLERAAISFSRGSSWPRDWTWVSRTVGRRAYLSHRLNHQGTGILAFHWNCVLHIISFKQ